MFLSLVKKTALNFLFTVLSYVQGALQKGLNHLLYRVCLMKNQETLQISIFSPLLLNLLQNVSHFLFFALP